MIELIQFSLKRRFLNKTNKLLMIFLIILFSLFSFLDKIIEQFTSNEPLLIKLVNIEESEFLTNEFVQINDQAQITITKKDEMYHIESNEQLSDEKKTVIESMIYPYYQNNLNDDIRLVLEQYRHPMIEYTSIETSNLQQKHDNLFMVITAIYFMMLGFAGMLAQEVVAEKTSNILELIGTSVSLKTHYYSKIIIGWLSILGQFTLMGTVLLISFLPRFVFDNGQGLLSFFKSIGLLNLPSTTFSEVIKSFLNQPQALLDLGLSLIFLFVGILIVQLVLVVISTRVISVEEAGSLQNPFYMGLLLLYYGALILNNPQSMTSGWGFILSFVPVFSMIFMPSRLMLYHVPAFDILVSFLFNAIILFLIIKKGQKVYVENVLNFSPKVKNETKNKRKFFVKNRNVETL